MWSAANEPPAVRKIIQNRGHFPSDEAVIKPLRISEIGLPPDASASPRPSRRRWALSLLRRAAKRREALALCPVTGRLSGYVRAELQPTAPKIIISQRKEAGT
jgi:hypothetical protein